MATAAPTLRLERSLLREGYHLIACADEVGRGSLAGPVTIGMVVVNAQTRSAPKGVKDSKLLTAPVRDELAPQVRSWAVAHSVGHATAAEIDEHGITVGLRLAGHRALAGLGLTPDLVLLDGSHDYLTPPEQMLLFDGPPETGVEVPPVRTQVKGDLTCAGIAAASILAKTERDAIMVDFASEFTGYGWEINKGYASPEHVRGIEKWGPCAQHRRSWSLPGVRRELERGNPTLSVGNED